MLFNTAQPLSNQVPIHRFRFSDICRNQNGDIPNSTFVWFLSEYLTEKSRRISNFLWGWYFLFSWPPGVKKFFSDVSPMIFQHCAGANGFRKCIGTLAGTISLRQHPVRKWMVLLFWDGGSTKTAKPKFSKIRQKSNFGPIVRSHMWKLIRRARPFR